MKRLGESDIRLGTVGETKAEADRKAGIKLVIIVETGAKLLEVSKGCYQCVS